MSNDHPQNKLELFKLRHTAEHVLHQAIKELYPSVHLAMGPATDEGFYFDFDNKPDGKEEVLISETDFPKIEKRMVRIVARNLPVTRSEISISEARKLFKGNPYKLEWIDEIEAKDEKITIYWTGKPSEKGSMVDLCAGPHIGSTGEIKHFKLLSVAGAYWRGSEDNKMLTRIYGTAFFSDAELQEFLKMKKEAKERDHKKLGKELDLFVFTDTVGKGLPLWTAKGSVIRRELERFVVDEEIKRGYSHVYTPDIANLDLYKKSGHYPYYKDSMYAPIKIEDEEYMLRPMSCPHHFELYSSRPHSYKELPIRIAELAKLYRFERSGELSGLMRVRGFCLADSHIICTKDQAKSEVDGVLDLIEYMAGIFGLNQGKDFSYRLSLGDRENEEKYFKDDASWDFAEDILRQVLVERGAKFVEAEKEAAFYGPKIDIQMRNVNGKEDTAFTVQYDFVMPQRFDLKYVNDQGVEEQPVVIHRSSIGSIERTIAFLIEKFAGKFPVWIAPVQAKILPVSDKYLDYAQKVKAQLIEAGVRAELDGRAERLQAKIRDAQMEKVPYMLVVGEREASDNTVAVRSRDQVSGGGSKKQNHNSKGQNSAKAIPINEFVEKISKEIREKSL